MLNKLLMLITHHMPLRVIPINNRPYLERYYVGQLFGATFYLHRFLTPDAERHLHNHPWGWGRSLVVRGSYNEEVVRDLSADGPLTSTRRIRWWNVVNGNHFHRIADAKPDTWTLFFHGPRVPGKGWGFLEGREFVPFSSASEGWWRTASSRHGIETAAADEADIIARLEARYGGRWYYDEVSNQYKDVDSRRHAVVTRDGVVRMRVYIPSVFKDAL